MRRNDGTALAWARAGLSSGARLLSGVRASPPPRRNRNTSPLAAGCTVAYIETVRPETATGALQTEYENAIGRAGRVWNILKIMSPNPAVLGASMALYQRMMHGPSPLSRAQREMLAVVVSQANDCHY